ncbi:ABC transporter ATP-binding protein [Candidatus Ozemobacteraceae bacterium]|nr:ABC transporter ATP-binding protein [Candidatus Ozemobacteraceae bacterium]
MSRSASPEGVSEASTPPSSTRRLAFELLWEFKRPFLLAIVSLALVDAFDITPPLLIKAAIDGLEKGADASLIWKLGGLYTLVTLGQALGRYIWRQYFIGTSHAVAFELRTRLYTHLQTLSFSYFTRTKTGELMSRLTNDIDEVRQMFGIGLLLIMDTLFYFLWIPAIMFWLSPSLSLYVLAPAPLIPFFVVLVGRRIHARSAQVQKRLADLSSHAQEAVAGIRVIKGFRRESAQEALFADISRGLLDDQLKLARLEAVFHPALELAMGLGIFLLIWAGGRQVLDGTITLGSFVAFQAYILKLVWPMTALGMAINIAQRGMASLARSREILDERPEITGPAESGPESPSGAIEVRNLTFTFPGCAEPVLRDITLKVGPGETLGIVGPVGSGKTTFLNLVMRLLDTPPGTVFIGGRDIREIPLPALRGTFGVVPQDAFLFSESVLENIAFGMKDKNDLSRARDCARIARILPEIEALPKGFETLLGERGVNLSGGQKQRLTLVRALAADPPVLVLDDTTSAVDADTEEQIRRELKTARAGRTTLIVSHRLASVQDADLIIHLDRGRIIERGTHAELLAANSAYARLWHRQQLINQYETSPRSTGSSKGEAGHA